METTKKKPKKQKIMLRDNIYVLKNVHFKRLLVRAGIMRISTNSQVYDYFRDIIYDYLKDLLLCSLEFTINSKRKIIKTKDLTSCLLSKGKYLAASYTETSHSSLKKCSAYDTKQKARQPTNVDKKPRTKLSKHELFKKFSKAQKYSDCLVFAKSPFARLAKELIQDEGTYLFSSDFIIILQFVIEEFIVELGKICNILIKTEGVVTLNKTHAENAYKIINNNY